VLELLYIDIWKQESINIKEVKTKLSPCLTKDHAMMTYLLFN